VCSPGTVRMQAATVCQASNRGVDGHRQAVLKALRPLPLGILHLDEV
jgi:hypothetical protein